MCVVETSSYNRNALLPTAWVWVTAENGLPMKFRALIDQGSEATLVSRAAMQRLGATGSKTHIGVTGVSGSAVGKPYGCVQLQVSSTIEKKQSIKVNAIILGKITSKLPSREILPTVHEEFRNICLADEEFWKPKQIDLLLGAPLFPELLRDGLLKSNGIVAQNTVFGWVLSGTAVTTSISATERICSHLTLDSALRRFWEQEEIQKGSILTTEEIACERIYNDTTERQSDGRYVVSLPFRNDKPELGETCDIAIRRLKYFERRIKQHENEFEGYKEFIATYIRLGHMERIPAKEIFSKPNCYLPHHAVFKPDSTTTKLRVVFDASAASSNGKSLNQSLLVGPKLQDNLMVILLRWRKYRVAFIADLEKMYRQIIVNPTHQDFQRIVWRNCEKDEIDHYRLRTVTYGTSCAPYLAIKTLQRLADDERCKFPLAAHVLKNDMYVDDCMSGADNIDEAMKLKDELLAITNAGGFKLLKWSSNNKTLLENLPVDYIACNSPLNIDNDGVVKALGVLWHPATDEFSYSVHKPGSELSSQSKRQVLSEISRLYDPMGLLAPVIITAKILLQQLWLTGIGWDDVLPIKLSTHWQGFRQQLKDVEMIRIRRWIGHEKAHNNIDLHGFSDASQLAFAACVYAVTRREDGSRDVTLLTAKSKVAPIKQQTVPRLELNGAVLLTRLLLECKQTLVGAQLNCYAWTDSKVVLAWLQKHANTWPTFIANRVGEIQTCMNFMQWGHVPGTENPADVASRGIMPSRLVDHTLWWTGPDWLKRDRHDWPRQEDIIIDDIPLEEKREIQQCQTLQIEKLYELGDRYSTWSKLLRITALCRRIIPANRRETMVLEAEEIEEARLVWLRLLQSFEFGDVNTVIRDKQATQRLGLRKLHPFVDANGIMRVGGRLSNASIMYDEQHPAIITGRTSVGLLIIRDAHEKVFHAGPQSTLGLIHQRYWMIYGRRQVRAILHKCVTCAKIRPRMQQQLMGQLPAVRVSQSRPFTHTGIDYAGPIWSRTNKGRGHRATKSWIAVFVCLSTKAVHLELVSDVTAAAFIAAFRRFTSRRGHCSDVYCDNATNFVGADKELKKQLRVSMIDKEWRAILASSGTKFHFSPPGSPHFNGLAEATVKMAKSAMIKVIGETKLTFEEMSTYLTQIEASLNSRPLCALSSSADDNNVLTPGHFLVGQPLNAIPEPNMLDSKTSLLNRWRLIQELTQRFWRRWSREYLHNLQQRQKWTSEIDNISTGDLVIIHDDTYKTKWKMGRVVDTFPGDDGLVRVVEIKTATGIFKRAITKISKLPIMI